jgi:hypothetical protein
MQHDLIEPDPDTRVERNPALWWLLGALLAAQLMALWMLCNQQVRKAEARNAEVQMTQMALSDCLQYIPGSTFASCTARLGLAAASQPATVAPGAAQRAVPVSYTVR